MATRTDNLRAAALMMASMASFVLGDTCIKLLGPMLPLAQVVVLRGMLTTLMVFALAYAVGQLRFRIPRADWGLVLARTAAEIGATYFFLSALLHMPIANITAIMQVLPLAVTLASAVFFKEAVGPRRWIAIAIGFVGMLLIVRPGTEGFDAWSVYALIAVICVTVRDLTTHRMSAALPSMTVTLAASIGVLIFAAIWSMGTVWQPVSWPAAGLIALASLFILGGYLFSVLVMRRGDIGFAAPFRYTGLVWALVIGLIVFGEWPDPVTLTGAAIICATGIFTLIRAARTA